MNDGEYVMTTMKATLKAKFHHVILIADRSEAGYRPIADLLARC